MGEAGGSGHGHRRAERAWGLDPVFYAPVRLLIGDMHRHLQPAAHPPGAFTLNLHPVRRVEVMGVCVERLLVERTGMLLFAVDDGSGCVVCVLWARAPDGAANHEWPIHHVQLGKLLRVQGRPTIYREELQLNTLAFQVEPDPNAEALHWLDALALSQTAYAAAEGPTPASPSRAVTMADLGERM